jgi:DNA end-binding protein Ku
MARSIWNGALSFGLINIPISIMSSKQEDPLRFRTLDKRDHALVGYRNYNKSTGEDVPKEAIVKGFEYEPNQFVVLTDEDFKKANPKATQTIDIQEFVSLEDLDPLLFEKPYYLEKRGEGLSPSKRSVGATKQSGHRHICSAHKTTFGGGHASRRLPHFGDYKIR